MLPDYAVALSLVDDLPRPGLTERLQADDPELLERAALHLDTAKRLREEAEARGVHVVPWGDPRFPAALLALTDCPPALWYRGSLACFDWPTVAIVGSRAATRVGLETAERLGADLAAFGLTVVSGLARGVDSAAHRGALTTGRTAAVLGSGLDHIYPAEHRGLAREIEAAGSTVVTEYPPATSPLPFRFPMRNRLISGLSRAVIVIEAAEDSGSLITAACALEQGREVMAVPGNVLTGRNRGGHALLRDGATIVECAADVVAALGISPPPSGTASHARPGGSSGSSVDPVVRVMDVGEAYDLTALASITGLDAPRLIARLGALELQGQVGRAEGGRFVRLGRTC